MSEDRATREATVDDLLAFADAIRSDEVLWPAYLRVGETGYFTAAEERRLYDLLESFPETLGVRSRDHSLFGQMLGRLRVLASGRVSDLNAPEMRATIQRSMKLEKERTFHG